MRAVILAAVGVGGAIGSMLRYFVAGPVQTAAWPGFPWGIFVVNITGGFVDGRDRRSMAAEIECHRRRCAPS